MTYKQYEQMKKDYPVDDVVDHMKDKWPDDASIRLPAVSETSELSEIKRTAKSKLDNNRGKTWRAGYTN